MFNAFFGYRWLRYSRRVTRRAHLQLQRLDARCVPHALALTPMVRASGPDPFISCEPPGWFAANGEAEPQLAVDPTNANHLVGVWNQSGHGIVAGVSVNGGNSWQEVPISGMSTCTGGVWPVINDPWVSFAANGAISARSASPPTAIPIRRNGR